VPAGPIQTVPEALSDPQVLARGMVAELDHPADPLRTLACPIRLTRTPATVRTPPPALGEHSDAVLAAAGYSRSDIERLRAAGAVG
jgi:formyl-CoA transferase/CoA:oxalate CoA-transferase